jgi:hypothetical protein
VINGCCDSAVMAKNLKHPERAFAIKLIVIEMKLWVVADRNFFYGFLNVFKMSE